MGSWGQTNSNEKLGPHIKLWKKPMEETSMGNGGFSNSWSIQILEDIIKANKIMC